MATQVSVSEFVAVDSTLPPKLDIHIGAKSHIFQPPRTPSASTSLHRSTACSFTDHDGGSNGRKRLRQDFYNSDRSVSNLYNAPAWSTMESGMSSALTSPRVMSPAPLVNTQYRLAGGLDTPTGAFALAMDRNDSYATSPELPLRGGRGWGRSSGVSSDSYFPQASPLLAREVNGRPRYHSSRSSRVGWGKAVYNVAGKVWEFCRANAFRGFYAGGGQGYHVQTTPQLMSCEDGVWEELEEKGDVLNSAREITSIPGCFPESEYIADYMSQNHTTPSRPAKKIQREKGESDLRTDWVMIGGPSPSRSSSPTRISARKVPALSGPGRRPMSRAGRRPILSASRPCSSFAGSPGLRSDRPASFASSRSPITTPRHDSTVNLEVQRHAARMRKRELEEDAHLKVINQQLKAMIKEGKEALGTTFEIEDEVDCMIDEGYAEGDCLEEREKE